MIFSEYEEEFLSSRALERYGRIGQTRDSRVYDHNFRLYGSVQSHSQTLDVHTILCARWICARTTEEHLDVYF